MEFVNNRRVFFGTDVYKQIPMILNQQKVRKVFLTGYNAEAHCVQMVREALSAHDIELRRRVCRLDVVHHRRGKAFGLR